MVLLVNGNGEPCLIRFGCFLFHSLITTPLIDCCKNPAPKTQGFLSISKKTLSLFYLIQFTLTKLATIYWDFQQLILVFTNNHQNKLKLIFNY
jgi:hypothetical protein